MAEPTFEDYLREREMLDKKNMMENLMKEYQEDMNRKKVMEQKQMASNDANERLLEQLYEQFLEEGFSPEVAAKKAREAFYDRDFAGAMGGRVLKQMASAPDSMDSLNDLAQMLFGKNLNQLTDDERDALDDYNKGLMAGGGRVGFANGSEKNMKMASTLEN